MVLGTQQMLQRLPAGFHVTLLGKEVTVASSARDLWLQVDSTLSFDEHITNTVSSSLGSLSDKLGETSSRHQDVGECYKSAGI